MLRDGNVLGIIHEAVAKVVVGNGGRTRRAARGRKYRDGCGAGIVGARCAGIVLAARIDGLDDILGIRAIVWLDSGRGASRCRG